MDNSVTFFVTTWIKFFFLFTPFFAVSMFLSLTDGYTEIERRRLVRRVTGAVFVFCFTLFLFGNQIFAVFGITIDAFRVGAGALLFLSAVGLVQAKAISPNTSRNEDEDEDVAVVPLALPVIVGPATAGALLVLGAELSEPAEKWIGCLALAVAIASIGLLLFSASFIERGLRRKGIAILSKITGLVLAAMAAQLILVGVRNVLMLGGVE